MRVSLVLAQAENGVIGAGGGLPWHLPADLRHFKALTSGHTIIMGRKTYESIGRPLPNRRSIVVTRDPGYSADGIHVTHSLEEALALAGDDDEVFVIGGAELFREALPRAHRIYRTVVHGTVEGDVSIDAPPEAHWRVTERTHRPADAANPHAMTFEVLERRRTPGRPGP